MVSDSHDSRVSRPGLAVGVLGTPISSGNRGVLALGSSLVGLCSSGATSADVTLFLGHNESKPVRMLVEGEYREIGVVHCRMSPRSRWTEHLLWILGMSILYRCLPVELIRRRIRRSTPWIGALDRMDVVGDVRGGDSFSDIYGMRRFLHGFAMAWTVLLIKGQMVQFPQTYGPFRRRLARFLAKFLLKRSPTVLARDATSRKVAESLLGDGRKVRETPDVAFSLPIVHQEVVELEPSPEGHADVPVIGINVNGLMYNGGYTRSNMFGLTLEYPQFLQKMIERLADEHVGEFWLVPHTFAADGNVESDNECSRKLRMALPEEIRKRVRIVDREYDQHEIKGVIGRCDFFVGSRMHACIGALSQGIPCVGVAYSMKFRGVFESVGVEEWVVDARQKGTNEAVKAVMDCYSQREEIRGELGRAAERARTELRFAFDEILDLESSRVSCSHGIEEWEEPRE